MKKISMLLLGLAGLFMTACTETEEGWANPQSNAQEDAITVPGFKASSLNSVIDLADAEEQVAVYAIPDATGLPEGFELSAAKIVLTPVLEDGEAAPITVETTIDALASKEELHDIIANLWNTNPNEVRQFAGHVYYSAAKDGQAVLIDAGEVEVAVKIDAPKIFSKYYMVGSFDGWTCTRVEGMELVNSGGDPYAGDSKFSIMFEPTEKALEDGFVQFKLVPDESFNEDGNIKDGGWDVALSSVNQVSVSETEGKFSYKNEYDNFKFDLVEDAIAYNITFDLIEGTYEIKPVSAAPQIWYLIGNCIGDGSWGNSFDKIGKAIIPMAFKGEKELVYTGYFRAGGQFKFVKTPGSWNEQMNYQNVVEGTDLVTDEDGNNHNIGIVEEGFYTITLNYATETIAIAKADDQEPAEYEVLGMCGAFQGWKEKEADDALWRLTKVENNDHVWFATFTFDTDTEGKFLTDWSWTVNWGATEFPTGVGVQGGSNIPITAGTYVVVFNDITGGYNFISAEE